MGLSERSRRKLRGHVDQREIVGCKMREGSWPTNGGRQQRPSFEPEGPVKPLSYRDSRSPKAHPMEGGVDPQSHVTARDPKDATRQVM